LPGEDFSNDPLSEDLLPIRFLTDFVFYDASSNNDMRSLRTLLDSDGTNPSGEGLAVALDMDCLEEEEELEWVRLDLGAILADWEDLQDIDGCVLIRSFRIIPSNS
jgi:hypothetical protein